MHLVPLVISADLPHPDVVVVAPDRGDRVMVFIDPRVPFHRAAEVVDGVRKLIKESADLAAALAACPGCTGAYALG